MKIIHLPLVLLLFPCSFTPQREDQRARRDPPKALNTHTLQRDLELEAERLLTVVENGDPKEVLLLMSTKGVVLGVDEPRIPLGAIRRQFDSKDGLYCALFDTQCLRKEDAAERAKAGAPLRAEPLYSYREILQKASARELKVSVSRISGLWSGYVTVDLTP